MEMSVRDFERLESFMIFKNNYRKSKQKKVNNDKAKASVNNLPTTDVKKLGFTDEQLRGLYGN
jgi:hypothetical protein